MEYSTHAGYRDANVSEKGALVVLEAAKRLMGWVVHSGSVYKITAFDHPVLTSVEEDGTAVAAGASASLSAGQYYHDRDAKILYLRTTGSVTPNSVFIGLVFKLFFSNLGGVHLPNDLASGFDVHWLPLLADESDFGLEMDTQNQIGYAIEGAGSLRFIYDAAFWASRYDKLYWENQRAYVYSWNRNLPASSATKIYQGRIQSKGFSLTHVTFQLKDLLNELRQSPAATDLNDVAGARIPDSLKKAKKRLVYGYMIGYRPTNIDQELDGYPLTGTVSINQATKTLTGVGTTFLKELSPDDEIVIGSDTVSYTIDAVTSDTAATITANYVAVNASGATWKIRPDHAKRYINRDWIVAGHALREPVTTVAESKSLTLIRVASVVDLRPDDEVTIGTESVEILRISGNWLALKLSLVSLPAVGASVTRSAVTNVYLNQRKLAKTTDYTYSAANGTLTLDELAEFNVAPIRILTGTLTFTNTSRTVTGSGTLLKNELARGHWIRGAGQSSWFEVLDVVSDTEVTLRAASTYTAAGVAGEHRAPEVYAEDQVVLSCDALGATDDGTTSGVLLYKAAQITKDILKKVGLTSSIDSASFTTAESLSEARLGLAIPVAFDGTTMPTARDVINKINQSVLGALIQDNSFNLQYVVLAPRRGSGTVTKLKEGDIQALSVKSDSSRIVKTAAVKYGAKEYDRVAAAPSDLTVTAVSKPAQYLAKTTKEQPPVETVLVDSVNAQQLANRWAFLLEVAASRVSVRTKLKGLLVKVTDPVDIEHEKLYQRVGSTLKRKVAQAAVAKRSSRSAVLELEDLANAFSRCATITPNTAAAHASASDDEKVLNGYITDTYGMIANDSDTHGANLIW